MSKKVGHIITPNSGGRAVCGVVSVYYNPSYREQITCKKCRKTPEFKLLPNWPEGLDRKRSKR